ncbi:hypothetical protein KA005_05880 [bacterium]|nr:hypothetical protein [bacterium]
MDSKRIYILGAGSSIGHSKGIFPSITGFFKAAKRLEIGSRKEFRQVLDYAKEATGRNLASEGSNFDIEAFFTHIEIELERNPSPVLLAIREQLLKLIQNVFLGLSAKIAGNIGEYQDLVAKLQQSDTIITFNWDLLLDNALNRERILAERYKKIDDKDVLTGYYWQFIYQLSAFGEMTMKHVVVDAPYQKWDTDRGYYLKAHGSIDWFYCSNEHCRASRKVFPLLEPDKTHSCSECHESLSSLVIPPVLNKGYRRYPLIRRIWNVAAKELSVSDEIVVWGYSLPNTDFYAHWLLSQARKSQLGKLTIINPSVVGWKKRAGGRKKGIAWGFVRRFYNIFRDKIPKESVCLYESFGDYCGNKDVLKKYSLGEPKLVYKRL